MKIKKVNNIAFFFVVRYLAIILLSYLTILVTGRIADMDVILGLQTYNAGGTTTRVALLIFSLIGKWGSKYLIIAFLGLILTFLLYLLVKTFINCYFMKGLFYPTF